MKSLRHLLFATGLASFALVLTVHGTASAHVVVKPAEVVTAGFQTFTVSVPNEKDLPTTSVKLVLPVGLEHVSPTQKPGWSIEVEREGSGEEAMVKSINWGGNTVEAGFRDEFTFSAKVPAKPAELQWKAYQTYADGTVVAWDKAGEDDRDQEGGNSGPFSVTKVVTDTDAAAATKKADQAAANAQNMANRAMLIGLAGSVVGFVGVFLATRKKS